DIGDEFLDQHRLAESCAAEQPDLAAFQERREQVYDLDAGLQNLLRAALLGEGRGRAMDRPVLFGRDGAFFVYGLAQQIEDAAQRLIPDGNGDGTSRIFGGHSAHQAVGAGHGDTAHDVVAQMLGDLDGQVNSAVFVLNADGVVDE